MRLHLNACSKKKNYRTDLAKHLLCALNERNDTLFSNPFMSSAIFFDPRFKSQLNEQKTAEAKETIKIIWRRMLVIDSGASTRTLNVSNTSNGSENISFEYDQQAEMDSFISGNISNEPGTAFSAVSNRDIDSILEMFDPEPIKSGVDIFQYWESRKNEDEILYKLATTILSIPATEVQIERDFSKLDFIFSKRRGRLEHERLDDIMVIHLNVELFEEVKEEELRELSRQ